MPHFVSLMISRKEPITYSFHTVDASPSAILTTLFSVVRLLALLTLQRHMDVSTRMAELPKIERPALIKVPDQVVLHSVEEVSKDPRPLSRKEIFFHILFLSIVVVCIVVIPSIAPEAIKLMLDKPPE